MVKSPANELLVELGHLQIKIGGHYEKPGDERTLFLSRKCAPETSANAAYLRILNCALTIIDLEDFWNVGAVTKPIWISQEKQRLRARQKPNINGRFWELRARFHRQRLRIEIRQVWERT